MNSELPHPPILVVVGATAVGKTSAVVKAAKGLNCEIVSADSRQIYSQMYIGTGAPSGEEMRTVRHHLINLVDPTTRFTAGDFARMAHLAVQDILRRGKTPILVGGSGLYVQAFVDGLVAAPSEDKVVRAHLMDELKTKGFDFLYDRLKVVDNAYAAKVNTNDVKRLIRALEVYEITNENFTTWHQKPRQGGWGNVLMVGLNRPRTELWSFIEKRVIKMFDLGWAEEVKSLLDKYGSINDLPLSIQEAIGYKEIAAYLNDEMTFNETFERIVIATRQYAKRQLTWFRADNRVDWREQQGEYAVQFWVDYLRQKLKDLSTLNYEITQQSP